MVFYSGPPTVWWRVRHRRHPTPDSIANDPAWVTRSPTETRHRRYSYRSTIDARAQNALVRASTSWFIDCDAWRRRGHSIAAAESVGITCPPCSYLCQLITAVTPNQHRPCCTAEKCVAADVVVCVARVVSKRPLAYTDLVSACASLRYETDRKCQLRSSTIYSVLPAHWRQKPGTL